MPKASDILGMNGRNQLFTSLNSKHSMSLANSKIATNILMEQHDIPTPKIHGLFATQEDVDEFDWSQLGDNFVIKPTSGLAGKGVLVFRKRLNDEPSWSDALGKKWSLEDVKFHCYDILEGQYSHFGGPPTAILQERILIHPTLLRYVYKGTPDVRIIVFNRVPVMAMLRLPTKESEGRANVHQGAIAAGIDIASGITTSACTGKGIPIEVIPDTKIKLRGIKIPDWQSYLETAVRAAEACQLEYAGVDLFVSKEKGPMVVELNARPGLTIQVANQAGLHRRLERVRDLNVLSIEHGVKIARSLFAAPFSERITTDEQIPILTHSEESLVYDASKNATSAQVLVNTGRFRSAISENLVRSLNLTEPENLLWYQEETKEGLAPVVEVKLRLKGKLVKSAMVVSKRLNKGTHQIELGRRDLGGFLVKTEQPS